MGQKLPLWSLLSLSKKGMLTVFLFANLYACACDCSCPSISSSLEGASVVFYGKLISTDTIHEYHNVFALPLIVDNYEVIKIYKGISRSYFQEIISRFRNGKYIISLSNPCEDPCGDCRQAGKMYIVYAYMDELGHLESDGCTRTREIKKDDFRIRRRYDPDFGKNEALILEEYYQANYAEDTFSEIKLPNNKEYEIQLNAELVAQKQQLDKNGTVIATLTISLLLALSYIAYQKFSASTSSRRNGG